MSFFRERNVLFMVPVLAVALCAPFMVGTLTVALSLEIRLMCMAGIVLAGVIIFFSPLVFMVINIGENGLEYTYFKRRVKFVEWNEMVDISIAFGTGLDLTTRTIFIKLVGDKKLILGINKRNFYGLIDKMKNEVVRQQLIEVMSKWIKQ